MKRNWITLIVSLVAFAKIVLDQFGISLPDNTADTITNFVSFVITVYGIFSSHSSKPTQNGDA